MIQMPPMSYGVTMKLYKIVSLATSFASGYDAIKMSQSLFQKLVEENTQMLYVKHGNMSKEFFMGLRIFIDYDTEIDYAVLGTSELFETDKAYPFIRL